MRTFKRTTQYKRDEKLMRKQGKDFEKLDKILEIIIEGVAIPQEYCDHSLVGEFSGSRELHIEPDWLLIYRLYENDTKVIFERTGSHSELFRK
jgi:mRNA interferase YafQ